MNKMINNVLRFFMKPKIKYKFDGKNIHICEGVNISMPEKVIIEDDVYIGQNCEISAQGGVYIGCGTILAHRVEILTRNHNYDSHDLTHLPFDNRYIEKPVKIHENVWVGACVVIVPGVTIGEGAVIGAGSVVVQDIPPLAVVGGNPSKIIKYRDKEVYENLKKANKIYMKTRSTEQ